MGEWHYPDGATVGIRREGGDFYRNRDALGNVFLHRRNNARSPRGIYYCSIPDGNGVMVNLYAGLYLPEGKTTITRPVLNLMWKKPDNTI